MRLKELVRLYFERMNCSVTQAKKKIESSCMFLAWEGDRRWNVCWFVCFSWIIDYENRPSDAERSWKVARSRQLLSRRAKEPRGIDCHSYWPVSILQTPDPPDQYSSSLDSAVNIIQRYLGSHAYIFSIPEFPNILVAEMILECECV